MKITNSIIKSELVDWRKLKWLQGNLKQITDDAKARLKESLRQNNFIQPFNVWAHGKDVWILDGHHRLKVMQELEEEGATIPDKLPANFVRCKNIKHAKTLVLVYSSLYAKATEQSLREYLSEHELDTEILNLIDLPNVQIIADKLTDDDDSTPDLKQKARTKPGALYECGQHRIMCADSAKLEDMQKLMAGKRAQLCITSPPYWVGKDYETQKSLDEIKAFIQDMTLTLNQAVNKDGGRIVINTSTASSKAINKKAEPETLFTLAWWQDSFRKTDWLMRHCRVWLKSGQLPAKSVSPKTDIIDQHWETIAEFLPTFYNSTGLRRGQELVKQSWAQQGIWDLRGEANMKVHGAAFPIEIPLRFIGLYTAPLELIIEPFGGTGTTLIAAQRTDRVCYVMELSPQYCDVIIQRWVNFTGIESIKLNGKTIKWKVSK